MAEPYFYECSPVEMTAPGAQEEITWCLADGTVTARVKFLSPRSVTVAVALKTDVAAIADELGSERLRIAERSDRIAALEDDLKALRLKLDRESSVLAMAVARLGGEVEGAPTHRINFLQRIDALREIERQHLASGQ